ncbi:hypothetical protein WAX74_04310 [Psychrobacillus sp. FJAT-51614]|uniref:Lipoprotein n=1 Tax=Psychrobacillus mangrovi TaxID=3117745 RepID=A0ABU8F4A3_9BACI
MWKKAVPVVALSSFLLVGCNNNDNAAPNKTETPMQEVREGVNDLTPNMNNNNRNGINGTGGTNANDNYNNNGLNNNPAGYNGGAGTGTNNGVNDETVPNANNYNGQTTKQKVKEITK